MALPPDPLVTFTDPILPRHPYPVSPLASLVNGNRYAYVSEFRCELGSVLRQVPVAFKSWGALNAARDNVMLVCHALTGSADVSDWWAPMLGINKVLDPSKDFVICLNMLASPYGTASPLSTNPATGQPYGPDFPIVTVRDSVRLHKLVLDALGVASIRAAIGGSLGGMLVLEWAFYGPAYVRSILPVATTGKHAAWAISMGETQRLTIFNDPHWHGGRYYARQELPIKGLANARMQALLTYRSRDAYERKFGRERVPQPSAPIDSILHALQTPAMRKQTGKSTSSTAATVPAPATESVKIEVGAGADELVEPTTERERYELDEHMPQSFTVQSYLHHQGAKFVRRFDANCYVRLTQIMDLHDISRGRGLYTDALRSIKQPTFVLGITSDVLYPLSEQRVMAKHIPNAELFVLNSEEGHDGFLIAMDIVSAALLRFLRKTFPDHYASGSTGAQSPASGAPSGPSGGMPVSVPAALAPAATGLSPGVSSLLSTSIGMGHGAVKARL